MKDNNGDLNGYGYMLKLIQRIDEKTDETAAAVQTFQDSLSEPLRAIAKNTSAMSSSLNEFRDENKDLIQIIAGKWQVPMPVFLVVVIVFAVWIVAEKVHQTGTEVHGSFSDFGIRPSDDRRDSQTETKNTPHP
jgi:hypothetical protein